MASPELQPILEMMRNRPSYKGLAIEELREGLRKLFGQYPRPEGIATEPVTAGSVPAEWVRAGSTDPHKVVYYLHGGAYVRGSAETHRGLTGRIAQLAGVRVLAVDYRLGPEHPFPAAVDDAVAGYRWLLSQGVAPARIVVAGDSAGGGLGLALLVALRDGGDPLPNSAVLLSPWTDLTASGGSIESKAAVDPFIQRQYLLDMAQMYLGGADPRDPLASPVFADLHGLPPLYIQVGTAETLLDDATRVEAKVKAAGGEATVETWDDMIHAWHLFAPVLPEGQAATEAIARFIRGRLD